MNILIGPKTGNITGIINWAESRILPFGFALCGLKNILGYIDSTGWHYYDNRHELEGLLWQEFFKKVHNASEAHMRLIRHARMAGLFCRYGYIAEGKFFKGVMDAANSSSLKYSKIFRGQRPPRLPGCSWIQLLQVATLHAPYILAGK